MSVYESGKPTVNEGHLTQSELHLYGSSRIGLLRRSFDVAEQYNPEETTMPMLGTGLSLTFGRGNKLFELSNHLGNVLVTVNDKKLGVSANSSTVDYFNPQVVSAQDYYPFGMLQPGRSYNAGGYRFGFNGKENDNEVKGVGEQQDYGMRISDPRLGRFLSVDPLTSDYSDLTPYQFASNTPIWAIDFDGMEGVVASPLGTQNVIDRHTARKAGAAAANWVRSKHNQGMINVNIAEQAKQQAIKQGRLDGDGINFYIKAGVYLSPWWNSTASYSDANDGAVLISGKNLNGDKATVGDYAAAGIGFFLPILGGKAIKEFFEGIVVPIGGYKYEGQSFKNATEFGKAVIALGGKARDKRALIESVTRQFAKTQGWKKSQLSGSSLGDEVYEIGKGKFGSVDKYHGNFEIYEKKGSNYIHQGSIDIDGYKNKPANPNYDVKL